MLSRYTFLTGAPGSRWSGVAQLITDNFNYDKSDESSFENDASVFAQIISSEEGEGITNKSEFNWTFFYR